MDYRGTDSYLRDNKPIPVRNPNRGGQEAVMQLLCISWDHVQGETTMPALTKPIWKMCISAKDDSTPAVISMRTFELSSKPAHKIHGRREPYEVPYLDTKIGRLYHTQFLTYNQYLHLVVQASAMRATVEMVDGKRGCVL